MKTKREGKKYEFVKSKINKIMSISLLNINMFTGNKIIFARQDFFKIFKNYRWFYIF